MVKRARLQALCVFWDTLEKEEARKERLKKSAEENKLTFSKRLQHVREDVKETCLSMYLNACKNKHALAFFQWRKMFNQSTDAKRLDEVFIDRVQALKRKREQMEKKVERGEKLMHGEKVLEESSSTDSLPPLDLDRLLNIRKRLTKQVSQPAEDGEAQED